MNSGLKVLETENLILRPFEKRDGEPFFEFISDRESCYMDGGYEPETSIKSKRYKKILKLFCYQTRERFMMELKKENRCIGTILLTEDNSRKVEALELGYAVCPAYQGKGYCTEALIAVEKYCFDELQVEMLTTKIMSVNQKSIRVMEKLGFEKEGILHNAAINPPKGVVDYLLFYKVKA